MCFPKSTVSDPSSYQRKEKGMGNSAGTGPKNEEAGEGPEPGNKSRTDSEGSRKEEIITYEEDNDSLEGDPGEPGEGSLRPGILHREMSAPVEKQERTGLIPKEPYYRNAYKQHGLIAAILVVIGIPALIFIAGNIAVSSGILPARARDIVTGVLFLAAVTVLMTAKS